VSLLIGQRNLKPLLVVEYASILNHEGCHVVHDSGSVTVLHWSAELRKLLVQDWFDPNLVPKVLGPAGQVLGRQVRL